MVFLHHRALQKATSIVIYFLDILAPVILFDLPHTTRASIGHIQKHQDHLHIFLILFKLENLDLRKQ